MPSSNSKIIRGHDAAKLQSWNIDLIGTHYESKVDRVLTEISMQRPALDIMPKARVLSREEEHLENWEMQLKEREAQLMSLEEEALQRGTETGRKQGYEAGWAAAERERETLAQAAAQLEQQFEQFKTALADKLLDLAVLTSKKVLADTLSARPDNAALLLQQVLDTLGLEPTSITLRANKATLAVLAAQLGDSSKLGNVRLVEDNSQLKGGFVLQHPEGEVDASIQTRWLRAIEALGKQNKLSENDLNVDAVTSKDKESADE